MPGWFASRSAMTSWSVDPSALTCFSPPVWVRRIVGIETVADTGFLQETSSITGDSVARRCVVPGACGAGSGTVGDVRGERSDGGNIRSAGVGEHVVLHDLDLVLDDLAVGTQQERPQVGLGVGAGQRDDREVHAGLQAHVLDVLD